MIGGLGSGIAAIIAGCGGDGGDGGDGEDPTDPNDGEASVIYRAPHGNYEEQLNYNPWNPQTHSTNMTQAPFGFYDDLQQQWVSEFLGGPIADANPTRGESVEFQLTDGMQWMNGDEYVAEDLVLHFELLREAIGEETGPWIHSDRVYAEDDETLVFDLTTEAAWGIISTDFWEAGGITPATPRHVFQEDFEAHQDASSDSAKQEATNTLFEKQIGLPDGPPNGWTAWEPVSAESQYVVNELREDHPWADDFDFERVYGVNLNLMKEQGLEMIQSGDLHVLREPLSESDIGRFEQGDEYRVDTKFETQCTALLINHDHDMLGRPEFRRALAYMIDIPQAAQLLFPPEPAAEPFPSPIQQNHIEEFLGDPRDQMLTYETDRERGEEILRDIGLSKQGGEWIRPDGESLDIEFISPPAALLDKGSSIISNQLNSLGITHDLVDKPGSYMWSQGYPEAGYDLVVGPWKSGIHPVQSMLIVYLEDNAHPPLINMPEEFSYPSEIGNLDSEEKTINVRETILKMPNMPDSEMNDWIKELTWAYNSQVVSLGISQKRFHNVWRVDEWEIPPLDTTGMGAEQVAKHLPKRGNLAQK